MVRWNWVAILILLELTLQCMYPACEFCKECVAILILLELTLQYKFWYKLFSRFDSRNPYFIGINSAIENEEFFEIEEIMSQSLFYWN